MGDQVTLAGELSREVYARAERLLPWNVRQLIFRAEVRPRWKDGGDAFHYLNWTREGKEFVLVDPAAGHRQPAFDHARMAKALSLATGARYVHSQLPFDEFQFTRDDGAVEFRVDETAWRCDLSTYQCVQVDPDRLARPGELPSPDGRWAARVEEHDLYIRCLHSGEEHRLTFDGEPYYDYATAPEARTTGVTDRLAKKPLPPVAVWSPDSRRLVTHRLDQRQVADLHLVQSVLPDGGWRPRLHSYRYAMPGDEHVPLASLVVFDITRRTRVDIAAHPLLAPARTPVEMGMVWWSTDGERVYYIEEARDHRTARLCEARSSSGEVRTILEERCCTYVDLSPDRFPPCVRVVSGGQEVIWFSERDGWGHLYLYGTDGQLRGQVTRGPWLVRELLHADDNERWVYFTAGGREGGDPYLRRLYRARYDGSAIELLTPEDGDHQVTMAPSGRYFVDTWSLVDTPPVTVLRRADGTWICQLERADIGLLEATGWKAPERFQVKARDGITDIYGVLYLPSDFDPGCRYPVLDDIYPGPQRVRSSACFAVGATRGDESYWHAQATAELGFAVVTIDGMGTPYRSKAFHDRAYGQNFGEAGGLADHVCGLQQLARERPYLDLARVGIYGHSGGGYAAARAMLVYPDFYRVAVSSAGNHDQRSYLAAWGERYLGLLEGDGYSAQANSDLADRLAGKLLLVYGDMDDNVHPAMVLQLVDALIRANRDFDLLVLPNCNHNFNSSYFLRRRWDYFVHHLLGLAPPAGYRLQDRPAGDTPRAGGGGKG